MSLCKRKGHLKLLACELSEHGLKRKFIFRLTQLLHGLSLNNTMGKDNNMSESRVEGAGERWKKLHKLNSSANVGMIKPGKIGRGIWCKAER
jgi:hypothetical protein